MDFHSENPVVAIVGGFQIGKSTLVNCLLDDRYAPTGKGLRTTAASTLFCYGEAEEAWLFHGDNQQGERLSRRQDVFDPSREVGPDDWFRISAWKPILQHVDIVDTPGYNAQDADDKSASAAIAASSVVVIVQAGKTMDDLCRGIVREACVPGKRCVFLLNCTNTECWSPDDPQNIAICEAIEAELKSMGVLGSFLPIGERLVHPVNALWAWYATGQAARALESANEDVRKDAERMVRKIQRYATDELDMANPSPSDMMELSGLSDLRQMLTAFGNGFTAPPDLPEEFKPAYATRNIDVALLGKPTGKPVEYCGIGEKGSALPMENGLLIHHPLLLHFSTLPWPKEEDRIIDILSSPNVSADLRPSPGGGSYRIVEEQVVLSAEKPTPKPTFADNPFSADEEKCLAQFQKAAKALAPVIKAMTWYRDNSAESYKQERDRLLGEIGKQSDLCADLRRQLEATKLEKAISGFFKGIQLSLTISGIESKVKETTTLIETHKSDLANMTEEAARHAAWPIAKKSEELRRKENECHALYLKYCRVRHFRMRMDEEVFRARQSLAGLDEEIKSIQKKHDETQSEIRKLEERLPRLREDVKSIAATIAAKTDERKNRSVEIATREESIKKAYRASENGDGFFSRLLSVFR